jgi:hypothetical protein
MPQPLVVPDYFPDQPTPYAGDALVDFVRNVKTWLDELVTLNEDRDGRSLYVQRLWNPLKAAWVEGQGAFEQLARRIGAVGHDTLQSHGLTGAQLRAKLEVIRYHAERYAQVGKRWLRKALDPIDSLLKSIISAAAFPLAPLVAPLGAPEFAGEVAEELKELVKNCIDDE